MVNDARNMTQTDHQTPLDNRLIELKNVKTHFFLREGTVRALDSVSFDIGLGEALGVVGESGCGKSVTAKAILRIVPEPGKIIDGENTLYRHHGANGRPAGTDAINLTEMDARGPAIRAIRGAEIAMIFQEPMTSFRPVHTIGFQIMEAIILHQHVKKKQARERAIEILARVGSPRPAQAVDSYLHQLSGSQRQRAMITMTLSCNPSLLMADEPTTALDVTTQAQILDLLRHLQEESGMAIMFISHNLSVVEYIAHRVGVMYVGQLVELADTNELFGRLLHPYTGALMSAVPKPDRRMQKVRIVLEGEVADPSNPATGCYFRPRCSYAVDRCKIERPVFRDFDTPDGGQHFVSCHRPEELTWRGVGAPGVPLPVLS